MPTVINCNTRFRENFICLYIWSNICIANCTK